MSMPRLLALFFLVDLALAVIALIDCLSTDARDIRALPRAAWIFLIVLFSPFGPIAWFIAGRPRRRAVRPGAAGGFPPPPRPTRPVAPDDDPEFLRSLGRQQRDDAQRRREEDLLRREEELRRREEELRRGNEDPPNA
jgi:hypothetical protein